MTARERRLEAALKEIVRDAPETEPVYDDWGGDTERAENWGGAQEHWRCAQIARKALEQADRTPHPDLVNYVRRIRDKYGHSAKKCLEIAVTWERHADELEAGRCDPLWVGEIRDRVQCWRDLAEEMIDEAA